MGDRNILVSFASFDADGNAMVNPVLALPFVKIEDIEGYKAYSRSPVDFSSLVGNEVCKNVAEFLKREKERITGVESINQVALEASDMEVDKEDGIKRKVESMKCLPDQ